MNKKRAFIVFIGLLFVGFAMLGFHGAYGEVTDEHEYNYEYQIKVEQVQSANSVNESVSYSSMSGSEREMLFDAFKRSDHFLGGASAYVTTDEPVANVTNEWRIVRVRGVPVLMAISGPEQVNDTVENRYAPQFIFSFVCLLIGLPTLNESVRNWHKW